jgi:hypothetical protein
VTEPLDTLHTLIRRAVRAGFDAFEEVIDDVADAMTDEHPGIDWRPQIEQATLAAFNAHRREQFTWPVPTDCDRLDRAFAALNSAGIVARQNFACCQNCGHDEIMDEVREAAETIDVRGYVFYHMQDTDSVLEDGTLFLAFGGRDDQQAVAWEIVEALKREALDVEWNGEVSKRIVVKNLKWLRRRDFSSWGRA